MPLDTVTVTGTLYHPNGALATDEPVTIIKVVKAGSLITLLPKTVRSHATTGVVTLTLPADSTAYLYSKVNGLNTNGREGVALAIPDEDANLEDLVAVAAIPSAGLTVKQDGVALASLIGTLNITGDGAVITQTAPGVAELEFTAGAGGGNHNLLSATHPDSTAASPLRGDLITGQGATPKWTRKAIGTSGQYLRSDGTDLLYSALLAADIPSLDTAKITSGQFADARIASAAAWNAKQDALGFTAENAANKNQAGGYAGLDGSSKLNPSHLPAIAISNYLGSVASEAAMLALTGERGDWAIRSDENKTYIIIGDDPTQLADWQGLATPTDLVSSVFGRTGVVTAQANDYTWAQIDKTTSSLADIVTRSASDLSSGTLPDARFPATLPAISGANLTSLTKSQVGLGNVENTALSTWAGSTNITTLGTIATGVWNATAIAYSKLNLTGAILNADLAGSIALSKLSITGTPDGTKFLRDDGSWQAAGGGGTPGGSDTQVQFNDGGAFGGDAGLLFNKTTNALTVGGQVLVPDGSASVPGFGFSANANVGFYQQTAGAINVTTGNNVVAQWYGGDPRYVLAASVYLGWSSATPEAANADVGIARKAAGVIRVSNASSGAGSLIIGSSSAAVGTSGVGVIVLENGTPPSSSPANCVQIYAEDVAASGELKVRDEAGNITVLGPHSWKRIPQGPSEEMAWSFYSERGDRYISVDMARMIRLVEKLSGEQLIYTGKLN